MSTLKKNASLKAMSNFLVSRMKSGDVRAKIEWEMAFYTGRTTISNDFLKERHVVDQKELLENYDRVGQHQGASKCCHTVASDNVDFQYIVVKRMLVDPYISRGEGSGNQLHDEAETWEALADTQYADLLCPTIRAYETRSDHNNPISDTALENIVVISQKAIEIGDLRYACAAAERLNLDKGILFGDPYEIRRDKLIAFARKQHWRDVELNPANSGVVWDYAKRCYKAVFIDYAL